MSRNLRALTLSARPPRSNAWRGRGTSSRAATSCSSDAALAANVVAGSDARAVFGIGAKVELALLRDGAPLRVEVTIEARPPSATTS